MKKDLYKRILSENSIKRPLLKNAIKAFVIGGSICLVSQALLYLFSELLDMNEELSKGLMYACIIGSASILTGFGIFDCLGQFSGAGTLVPITGFSNSMTSSALESKSEGIVLGIMVNMFKLAGAVIVAGVVSAFFFGTIIYLFS